MRVLESDCDETLLNLKETQNCVELHYVGASVYYKRVFIYHVKNSLPLCYYEKYMWKLY